MIASNGITSPDNDNGPVVALIYNKYMGSSQRHFLRSNWWGLSPMSEYKLHFIGF